MVTDQEIVQWGYLLDPCFELTNSAGAPLTNGWIECYIHGTRKKYYCASDFNGTLHPFKIPLDSLGSNIVLADPNKAYDVYVYNRFGSLVMSRYNVSPGHASGTAVVGGGDAEHWIGHGGSSVTIESGTYASPLPLPSSPDYEGTFVDRVVDNEMVLKNGVYLFDAVIRFRQDPQDLTNTIRDLSIHTGLSDTETTVYEMDGAGPDADVDNIHQIRVQFIRHVDSEYNNIFHLQLRSPNDLQFAMIQNLSIVKLGGGSASGGSQGGEYEAGDYVEITDENVINVTGIQPAGNYVSGTTYTHDMYDVNQQLGALSGQIREVSGAIPSLEGYATQDWVEQQGYLTEVPPEYVTSGDLSSYVTETEMQSAISGKADTSAIPSLEGYATETWVNDQGFIKEVPSEYVTESEMSGYVQEHTSGFLTSADLPDVSDMATQTWVTEQHYITSADVPPQIEYSAGDNIDITDHVVSVTDTSLLLAGDNVSITPSGNDYIISAQVPETSGYVTEQEMNDAIQSATSAFITSADIPDLPDDLVTSGELATVSGEIVNQIPSLQGYATEEYVTEHTSAFITSADLPDLSDYATESYVQDAIDSGTSAFITSADLPDVSDMATKTWVGEQGYLTSVPSEYVTDTELESELSGKADTSAIPDVSNFVTQEDIDAAVSGKMDATESSAFYPMATNPSGYLVSSDLNGYATESYVQDYTSGFVDYDYVSEYVDSQTSGKQDQLSFEYNEESAISAINGSALAGGSSFDPSVLSGYIPYSATSIAAGSSNTASSNSLAVGSSNKASTRSLALGQSSSGSTNSIGIGLQSNGTNRSVSVGQSNRAAEDSISVGTSNNASTGGGAIGTNNRATIGSYAGGNANDSNWCSFSQGDSNVVNGNSMAVGMSNSATSGAAAVGMLNYAYSGQAFGRYLKANHGLVVGEYNYDSGVSFGIGRGTGNAARADIFRINQSGDAYKVVGSGEGTSYKYLNEYDLALDGNNKIIGIDGYDIAGGTGGVTEQYVQDAVASGTSGKQDTLTFGYDSSDKINAINGSAIAGGGGGHEYSGANGVYVDNENEVIRLDTSASNAIETVIENSGAWGGAGLPISAGPGIKVGLENGVLMISNDEIVLYSANPSTDDPKTSAFTVSEPLTSFEKIRFENVGYTYVNSENTVRAPSATNEEVTTCFTYYCKSTDGNPLQLSMGAYSSSDGLTYNLIRSKFMYLANSNTSWQTNTTDGPRLCKIVGIGRKSN